MDAFNIVNGLNLHKFKASSSKIVHKRVSILKKKPRHRSGLFFVQNSKTLFIFSCVIIRIAKLESS